MPDGDDQSGKLRACVAPLLALTSITMLLRCYARRFVIKSLGWDDGVMIITMVFYIPYSALLLVGSFAGPGRRTKDLTENQVILSYKYLFLAEVMYATCISTCKVSVCIFFTRLTVKPLHTRLVYALLAIICVSATIFLTLNLVKCRPISYWWDQLASNPNAEGTCMSTSQSQAIAYGTSSVLVFTDVNVGIILPIIIIRKLQMRKASKIAVVCILGLACLSATVTIARFPYLLMYDSGDYVYNSVVICMLAHIELSLAVMAANIATLGPLLRTWLVVLSNGEHTPTTPIVRSFHGRPRGVRDISFPLSIFDETATASRLRPDKLSITVTQVTTQHHSDVGDANASREQLTFASQRAGSTGSSGELGPGIYRTTEVSQTSDVESMVISEHRP
ncbi:hypothetical protein BDV06DRAFT_229656 [Aspergillus oleicola]